MAEYFEIILGEVTAVDSANSRVVEGNFGSMKMTPISVTVIEALKGRAAGSRRLLQEGAPSSCEINLAVGERRLFLIWKPGREEVGYCNALRASETMLAQLRAARKADQ